jgi:hypothetical protein
MILKQSISPASATDEQGSEQSHAVRLQQGSTAKESHVLDDSLHQDRPYGLSLPPLKVLTNEK